jgi:gliding motility-associated-like protein
MSKIQPFNTVFFFLTLLFCAFSISGQVANFNVFINGQQATIFNGAVFTCQNDVIEFKDASTGSPLSLTWDIPKGQPSTFSGPNPPPVVYSNTKDTVSTVKLTATYASGTSTFSILVRLLIRPKADFYFTVKNQIAPASITVVNNSNNYTVLNNWFFGDGTMSTSDPATHTYTTAGIYPVKLVVSKLGVCFDSITQNLEITDGAVIKMPNVFTPDDDNTNTNELFRPTTNIGIKSMNCNIYDRWGNLVYTWEGVNGYWDGYNSGGLPCTSGAYFYKLLALSEDNKEIIVQGFVQLIR